MSYGKKFVAHRRVVQQEFQPNVVADLYRPVMIREVTALLERLFDSPDDLIKHLKQYASSRLLLVDAPFTRPLSPEWQVRLL